MAIEIKVPAFGESVTESTIAKWLKADGAFVKKGEDIVSIDTEKASSELQAEASGKLTITAPAGADVKIGAVIGSIDDSASPDAAGAPAAPPTPAPAAAAAPSAPAPAVVSEPQKVSTHSDPTPAVVSAPAPPIAATPAAAAPAPAPAPASKPATAPPTRAAGERETREPMSRLRRTLAAHLLKAKQETAMLTTFAEVDMSAVMAMRARYQDQFVKRHGIKLGFMSFFIKASAEALQRFPLVNASLDGNDIVHHHYYDIAVAVSTERGLVVPVLRDADRKTHAELEKELVDVAGRARANKLSTDEMKGGTFTITNGGVFGSLLSTPLLNPPQVGILGMHSIVEKPVAIDGKVEIRPMMFLALSYDHRLIDGREAVQFLVTVRDHIASPERAMLGL